MTLIAKPAGVLWHLHISRLLISASLMSRIQWYKRREIQAPNALPRIYSKFVRCLLVRTQQKYMLSLSDYDHDDCNTGNVAPNPPSTVKIFAWLILIQQIKR